MAAPPRTYRRPYVVASGPRLGACPRTRRRSLLDRPATAAYRRTAHHAHPRRQLRVPRPLRPHHPPRQGPHRRRRTRIHRDSRPTRRRRTRRRMAQPHRSSSQRHALRVAKHRRALLTTPRPQPRSTPSPSARKDRTRRQPQRRCLARAAAHPPCDGTPAPRH